MSDKSHQSFTELEVWKQARLLKNGIRDLTKVFPADEKFRLTDQLIRSSRSVGACIAEGHGRYTSKDQLHFCIMARGSLSEIYNHLIDAFDCGFIQQEDLDEFKNRIDHTTRLLNGYINFLRKGL